MITYHELPELLRPHLALLQQLADSWMAMGATNIGLWAVDNDQPYAIWDKPAQSSPNQPTYRQISAPIETDSGIIAYLYVFGPNRVVQPERLRLDAAHIATQIVNRQLEQEREALSGSSNPINLDPDGENEP